MKMWNIFDTSFVAITVAYLFCRLKGLADGDGWDTLFCLHLQRIELGHRVPLSMGF
jgi:hypothetical protein